MRTRARGTGISLPNRGPSNSKRPSAILNNRSKSMTEVSSKKRKFAEEFEKRKTKKKKKKKSKGKTPQWGKGRNRSVSRKKAFKPLLGKHESRKTKENRKESPRRIPTTKRENYEIQVLPDVSSHKYWLSNHSCRKKE